MTTITVNSLSKKFKLYKNPWGRLAEFATLGGLKLHKDHWALKDISFNVGPGESIGLIGKNGSGKTTLLKILAGVTSPTQGAVQVNGTVGAILGLGVGFHPMFTGSQNAVRGCYLQGLSKSEIKKYLPEIVEFSELGDSMDDPLRTYSSGMHMRLAFGVVTARRPDILIIDEALAVGDAQFRSKCIERLKQYLKQGTTLLFVSHGLDMVKTLCDRAVLLHQGEMIEDGPCETTINRYHLLLNKK